MQKSVGEFISKYKGLKLELVSPSPTIPHDPPYKEMKINILIEKIIYRKLLKKDGILIIHRHKKDKIVITEKINILDTRTYGVSKVYFAN